jgi:general secretion pathway protein K
MRRLRTNRGAALLVVLWVAILITIAAAMAMRHAQTDRTRAIALRDQVIVQNQLDSALAIVLDRLASTDPAVVPPLGSEFTVTHEGQTFSVLIQNEAGLVDINAADEALLTALLGQLELSERDARKIAQQILDWRDRDDDPAPFGAEVADYRLAERTYGPRNGPFESVEEFTQVLAVDDGLYRAMQSLVTVYTRSASPVPSAAPPPVRAALESIGITAPPPVAELGLGQSLAGTIVRVAIRATVSASPSHSLTTVVRLTGDTRAPTITYMSSIGATEATDPGGKSKP